MTEKLTDQVAQFLISILKKIMSNDKKFPEQEAPVKNTDNAFVQVGEDGAPVIPSTEENKTDIEKEDSPTTIGDR